MNWLRHGTSAYWIVFVAVFLAVAVWESLHPKRQLNVGAGRRWANHGTLFVLSAVLTSLVFRLSPIILAIALGERNYGLLSRPWIPLAVRFIAALLVFDFVIYAQHRLMHSVSFLWRVHSVHHSDPDFEVSTALRFHPLEFLIQQGMFLGVVALLGPPPAAVLVAQLLAVAEGLFVHANTALPKPIEKVLRLLIFTPDLHRIHHSQEIADQNSNFGQLVPWWDRILGTYKPRPVAGEQALAIGLTDFRNVDTVGIRFLLTQPFQAAVESLPSPARAESE